MLFIILFCLTHIHAKNIKANRNFKVPKITSDYLIKCENIFTYFLQQDSTISVEEDFTSEKTDLDHVSAADIQATSPDVPIIFECPIMLKSGPILTTTLHNAFGFTQTWTILHHDDFESRNSLIGWNVPHRAYCDLKRINYGESEQKDHFIEPTCHSNQQILKKSFNSSVEHQHVKVTAELTLFGDWNGDSIIVTMDSEIVWQKVFQGQAEEYDHPCPNLMALAVPVQFTVDHKEKEFNIQFSSTHSRHPCDGSFGLDDLIVYYK